MPAVSVSGPVVELVLRGPAPASLPLRAEGGIDTGASIVCIDRRLALQLGLRAINRTPMLIADGTEAPATVYELELEAVELGFRDLVRVAAVTMEKPSTRVLLGRSFLRNFILTYHGGEDLFHWFRLGQSSPEELDG